MNTKTGILYSSTDGQTIKICTKIKDELSQKNQQVEMFSIDNFNKDLKSYSRFIIGASIRYGKHNKKIIDFINNNKKQLNLIKTAFFSVNLVARKPEKKTPNTNPYVIKFLENTDWNPNIVEVFAGKLDYKKYSFFDRVMIQFIMLITKGPIKPNTKIEYTDWDKVTQFANQLIDL